jgi:DNA invertase Pin-like site-specific DNA recombinase
MMNTQEKPRGNRGAGYIRVSREKATGGRADEKASPEAQKATIRDWCRRHSLPEPARWYMDVEGKNSRDTWEARENFQQMISDAEGGQWDWIVVDSQERFGSGQKAFNFYLYRLELAGCELWSVSDGNLSGEDDGTIFLATVNNQTGTRELRKNGERQVSRKRILAAQGEWQGGYVPYGADVVCVGPDGREKFRVVIIKMVPKKGVWHRVRVWPDGRQERFDGEAVFPVKEQTDRFYLAPSIIGERVETARDLFDLFSSGAWTQRGLCKRLNARGIDPVYGEGWYSSRLGPLLRNPFYYIGQTVWGKKSHGKNSWYVGGEYVIPPKVRGKAKTGRKNDQADWVFPEEGRGVPSVAIVDKATWEAVQEKLKPGINRKRGLRDPNLWLSGLLVCARCGEPMDGWGANPPTYVCRTYRRYGASNKTGCRLHRVRQSLLECLVSRYLEDLGPQVKSMLESREDPSLVRELHQRLAAKEGELFDVFGQMKAFVEGREVIVNGHGIDQLNGILGLYQALFEQDRGGIETELAAKEAELAGLVKKFEAIPEAATAAHELFTKRLVAADAEVRELRDKLAPLTNRLEAVYADLARLDADLDEVRESLPGDNARRKAEALRRVLKAIRLSFRHFEYRCHDRRSKAETRPRSTLESVEFIPLVGEPATLLVTPDADLRNVQPAGARLMTVRPGWRS